LELPCRAKIDMSMRHGIEVQMHRRWNFRAAGPQASAGTLLRDDLRRAQQPTSLIPHLSAVPAAHIFPEHINTDLQP
jgi:hypothetical protein